MLVRHLTIADGSAATETGGSQLFARLGPLFGMFSGVDCYNGNRAEKKGMVIWTMPFHFNLVYQAIWQEALAEGISCEERICGENLF